MKWIAVCLLCLLVSACVVQQVEDTRPYRHYRYASPRYDRYGHRYYPRYYQRESSRYYNSRRVTRYEVQHSRMNQGESNQNGAPQNSKLLPTPENPTHGPYPDAVPAGGAVVNQPYPAPTSGTQGPPPAAPVSPANEPPPPVATEPPPNTLPPAAVENQAPAAVQEESLAPAAVKEEAPAVEESEKSAESGS